MKPRDRQLAAIRHEVTDRVAIDAIHVENLAAIGRFLGVSEAEAYARLGIDGRIVCPAYTGPAVPTPDGKPGGEWGTAAADDYGTTHVYPFSAASTVRDVDAHPWPDPSHYDFAAMAAWAKTLQQDYAVRGPYWKPIFCTLSSLMGMEDAMVAMIQGSPAFEAMLARVADVNARFTKLFMDACGDVLDIYCLGDDFATQRGMMFSPTLWRRYLKPIYAKQFALAREAGKPVWFHSCGDITEVLPDLIDIGMNVWETVQLHTLPMSPEELKRQFGKHITFFGGINTQNLPFADVAAIREEVRRCIKILGKNGGYICGPDHHIKHDIPADKTLAIFETAQQFRLDEVIGQH